MAARSLVPDSRWTALLRQADRRLRCGLVSLAVMSLTGCGGVSDGFAADETPVQTVISVPGVASCTELGQAPTSESEASDSLPALLLPCLTPGPTIDLSTLSGRPTLVNLWASWCGPCREETPVLQAAHEQYGEQVQFLGVDTKDSTEAGASFLEDFGVTYPNVIDLEGALLNQLGVPGLPVTVVLDEEGRILGRHVGQLDPVSIDDLLASVLR